MPSQRLPGPPGIASGGFTGGVAVQPAAVPQGNELIDFAEALGNFGNQFSRSAQTWHRTEQDRKVIKSDRQREQGGKEAELLIANQLKGYTAAQIGEAIDSEPMAKKFAENPYIMPAVQIHRGRVAADEAFQGMLDAGVNVRNPAAAQKWLKDNVGALNDPFLSQGFNEQWARHDSQLKSMQSKDALEKADADRAQMGATEWDATFSDTLAKGGTVQQAAANAITALYEGEGVAGYEATEIAVRKMAAAALDGNVELVDAIADAPRGSAPTLAADGRISDDVKRLRLQAKTEHLQKREGLHVDTRTSMYDLIDKGITRPALEAQEGMKLLHDEDPEKYGQIIERHRAEQERKAAEAKRAYAVGQIKAVRNDIIAQAAQMIGSGEGEFITDSVKDLGEGIVVDVSRAEQLSMGAEALRTAVFPEGWKAVPDNKLELVRTYTRKLQDSGVEDKQLSGFLQGTLAYLTPEGLQGNEKDLTAAFRLYKHMDPAIARSYFSDAKQVAVFEAMDKIIAGSPDADLSQAAARAVARAQTRTSLDAPPKDIRQAIESMRVIDPLNPNQGFLGIGAGPNRVSVPTDLMQGEFIERVGDLMSYGTPKADAIERTKKELEESFTMVYGKPVRLPNDPKAQRATPESWAKVVTSAIDHLAAEDKQDPKGYTVTHKVGETYLIAGPPTAAEPNGELHWVTSADLVEAASNRFKQQQADTKAEREKAARDAAARRANPMAPPLPTTLR